MAYTPSKFAVPEEGRFTVPDFSPTTYEPVKGSKVNSVLDIPSFAYALAAFPEDIESVLREHNVSAEEFKKLRKSVVFQNSFVDAVANYSNKKDVFASMNKAAAIALLPHVMKRAMSSDESLKDLNKTLELLTSNAGMSKKNSGTQVNVSVLSTKGSHSVLLEGLDHLTIEGD